MLLIYKNMSLGTVISSHTSIIPVLERMGVSLGVGESTVEEICKNRGIDVDFFLAILNTFINEDYFPSKSFENIRQEDVLAYMRATYVYYVKGCLPVIEFHLSHLVREENSPLKIMKRMMESLKEGIVSAMEKDCNVNTIASETNVSYDTALTLVEDIKNLIIKHIAGSYDKNMCYAVLFFLSSLQKDMRHYARIRTRVLIPMMK